MIYPAVVFSLALVVMIVVVAVIVPVFVGIFNEISAEQPGGEDTSLPLMTQITVGVSDFVTHQWYLLLARNRRRRLRLPALEEDRPRPAPVGPLQAPHPADRRRGAEGRAGALVAHLLGNDRLGRTDPPGDRDLRRDRRATP